MTGTIGVCRIESGVNYRRLPDALSAFAGCFLSHRLRPFGLQMLLDRLPWHRLQIELQSYYCLSKGLWADARLLFEIYSDDMTD